MEGKLINPKGLRQMRVTQVHSEHGYREVLTPHGRKVIAQRRRANKIAKASRRANRGR